MTSPSSKVEPGKGYTPGSKCIVAVPALAGSQERYLMLQYALSGRSLGSQSVASTINGDNGKIVKLVKTITRCEHCGGDYSDLGFPIWVVEPTDGVKFTSDFKYHETGNAIFQQNHLIPLGDIHLEIEIAAEEDTGSLTDGTVESVETVPSVGKKTQDSAE